MTVLLMLIRCPNPFDPFALYFKTCTTNIVRFRFASTNPTRPLCASRAWCMQLRGQYKPAWCQKCFACLCFLPSITENDSCIHVLLYVQSSVRLQAKKFANGLSNADIRWWSWTLVSACPTSPSLFGFKVQTMASVMAAARKDCLLDPQDSGSPIICREDQGIQLR